jgi:C4-dicarboxylate-binding protein DctP
MVGPIKIGAKQHEISFSAAIVEVIAAAPMQAHAETVIRVTLQLPIKRSLGQNWLAFKSIVEKQSS